MALSLQYAMFVHMWSSIIYKNTASELVFNRIEWLPVPLPRPYFSPASGSQDSLESRKWGVNTWDQPADDSPSLRAKPQPSPLTLSHISHPRRPEALSPGQRWEERGVCDGPPGALQRWANRNKPSRPQILFTVLLLSGPIKSGFTWHPNLASGGSLLLWSCDYHSST